MTILLASLFGLAGSALVTLLVTRIALAPIRAAFAAERRFVAAASHELRTPVAVLRAQAEVLAREDLVEADGRLLVDDLIAESDRLGRLVGDLLALSTAEAGALEIEHRPIEVRALVANLGRRVDGMARGRGHAIEIDQRAAEDAPALTVLSDPDRLTQLLLIFIDNALDHSPDAGAIRLTVAPVSNGDRQYVTLSVADQGPGVPPADRERIFEPFATLRGRRLNGESTGLGLAIARVLASRLGASLRVGDAAGGGAVFSVTLPVA
jgi:signal transduction histidine kinase